MGLLLCCDLWRDFIFLTLMMCNLNDSGALGLCEILSGYDVDIVALFCIQGDRKRRKAVGVVRDAEQADL